MKKPSDSQESWAARRAKIIGLGERSLHKSHYPELRARVAELEAANRALFEEIERRQAVENALRESETRFRTLFDGATDGMILADVETQRLSMPNAAFCRVLGYSKAELGRMQVRDLHPEEDWPRVADAFAQQVRGALAMVMDMRVKRKDGGVFYADISASPIEIDGRRMWLGVFRDVSARRQAEGELLAAQNLLTAAIEQTPAGVIVADAPDVRIRMANAAALDIRGRGSRELTEIAVGQHARRWRTLYPDGTPYKPEDLPLSRAVLRGETSRDVEVIIERDDGEQRWVAANAAPVYDAAGQIMAGVVVFSDITERKRVEGALRRNERFLASVLESIQDGISVLDADLTIRAVNPVMNRWYAQNLPLEGKKCHECYHRSSIPCDPCPTLHCIESGQTEREIVPGLAGSPVEWIELFSYPMKDAETGEVTGVVEFVRDITERMRAEQEVRRLATAVEQAADAVLITKTDGTIVYVNPAFERVTGYARAEALGKNPRVLKSGEHDEAFYADMWRTIARGATWTGRVINRNKQGALYHEDVTISPVRDRQGEIQHFVAVKRDVTREVMLEAQLRQAQKMEAVGQLAGGVAHDFNNILTAILGNVELALARLERAPADESLVDGIRQIERSALRASDLTRQLLAFSRKQVFQPQVMSLNDAVRGTENMIRRLISENIVLDMVCAPHLPAVRADPGQIEQVILNLVVNARDALPAGGRIAIETQAVVLDEAYVATHSAARRGPHLVLAVSDTGCGMDAHTKEHIFEPFFTTKRVGEGTGLGLATVHGIVSQSGGHVTVYSEPGRGTTFKVYLPALDEASPEPEEAEALARPLGGTERVLLCEDDDAVRRMAERMLREAGYTVLVARNGAEAREIAQAEGRKLDLLVSDVIMPDTNGKALADALRVAWPGLAVLYVSGYTSNVIVHHGVLDEGVEFLEKPFDRRRLLQRVREVLDARGAG